MERIERSKYLQIVKREKDYAAYHSLFGRLCFIDQKGVDFLRQFQVPSTINDVIRSIGQQYSAEELRNYIHELRSRLFLVPEKFDEYKIIKTDIKNRKEHLKSGYLIRALQLVMSNNCNFRCKYCILDKGYDPERLSSFTGYSKNRQMSFQIAKIAIENVLELLRKNGNDYLNIEFFGGEPLLNWVVVEYVLETFKNKRHDIEIIYSITTNGSLITERMADIFNKYGVTVVVSLESTNENTQRVLIDGRSSINLIKRSLEILKKKKNWVTFNSVISKETIDDFDGRALVDFARYYNIAMIGLILDLDLGFYTNNVSREKAIEKIWDTYKYAQKIGIPVVGYWHQIFDQIIGRQGISIISGYKTCPATGCKLSVEPDGRVFICKCCTRYLGHISNIYGVLSSDQYSEYAQRSHRNAPECEGCEIEGFCSGVCMGSLERNCHALNVIEESSCSVFKEITKKLIQDLSESEAEKLYMPNPLR